MFQVMGMAAGRKDSNYEILLEEVLLARRKQGAEVRMIDLKDYELLDYNGCTACTTGMSMGKNTDYSLTDKDDKQRVMDVVLEQSTVVFSAPTYDLMPSSLFLKFVHRNLAYELAFLTKIGATAPQGRVGALIAMGGSTRSWQSMTLGCIQATTFTNSFGIVDMYMVIQILAPAQMLLYKEKVARVREVGLSVMKAPNAPPAERKWLGDPDYGWCFNCHSNVLCLGEPQWKRLQYPIGCVTCDAGGILEQTEDGRRKFVIAESGLERDRTTEEGRGIHCDKIAKTQGGFFMDPTKHQLAVKRLPKCQSIQFPGIQGRSLTVLKFEHLFSPTQVGKATYRDRIVSALMAFGPIVQNPDVRDFTYHKLEASAKGGDGCVTVGETDVNFTDAVHTPGSRPFDFAKPEEGPEAFDVVGEYARHIKRHGTIALAEPVHCNRGKVPFDPGQGTIGPIGATSLVGARVRPMSEDDIARTTRDFVVSATYMQKAGSGGVFIHDGHGPLFAQFLSPLMNTRTDNHSGSLENHARPPFQTPRAVQEAVSPDFLVELCIGGTDRQSGGITPEEAGALIAMAEPYITSVHVTCGIYGASVKPGTESSMFHPHGLNVDNVVVIKRYTKLPVGTVGGVNSPELCEQVITEGKTDFATLDRRMLVDPELANRTRSSHEGQIRRCPYCYECFPGFPEEGYNNLPSTNGELALYVSHCTINPLVRLLFDPDILAPVSKQEIVLIVGDGAAGMQAAIAACDRDQEVILVEQGPHLGGLLWFADMDTDEPGLMNFRNLSVHEVKHRDTDVRLNTVITLENPTSSGADGIIFATGSLLSCPPASGIGRTHKAMGIYDGNVKPDHKTVMVGGGLVGYEADLFPQEISHEAAVVELLDRPASESFSMYREALIQEIGKYGMIVLPRTHCLEIIPTGVRVENAGGVQALGADTVLSALGMKNVDAAPLGTVAEVAGLRTWVIGDAIQPGKADQVTCGAYLADIGVGR